MVASSTPQRKNPRYFFWDNKLHKVLRINRPANLVEAWCYDDRNSVSLLFTEYKTHAKIALRTGQAAKIMRVSVRTMKMYVIRKQIHAVGLSYAFDGKFGVKDEGAAWNETKVKWWWGEHNLMELHDYIMSIHRGGKRNDGKITPTQKTPSKAEIRAAFNNSTVLYVKGASGEFIPTFEQPKW